MWVYIEDSAISNAYIWIPYPESITLDKSSINLTTVWQTEQLTATIEPTISDHSVTWSSDDTTVATVNTSWLVTCVNPWSCTITATTANGLTATCGVTDQSWWQPWANTLVYMPLDWDVVDYSGNNNNGTWIWTASYQDVYSWSSKKWAYFSDNSAIDLTALPVSWNTAFTHSCWVKTNADWVAFMHHFWRDTYGRRSVLCMFYIVDKRPHQDTYWTDYILWNATTSSLWETWINIIYTYNSWNNVLYINWQQYGTASWNLNIQTWYNKFIWRSLSGASYTWYMLAESIIEDVVWTGQEALDYYNLTKGDFWIS